MSLRIPQEIVDHIIDYNYDDSKTLLACAKTSRDWCTSSYFHLFRSITITNLTILWRFAILLAKYPRVACYIRELFFNGDANYRDASLPLWIHEIGRLHTEKLTRLSSLRFEKIEWERSIVATQFTGEFIAALSTRFSGVQEVHFSGCSFTAFSDFERLMTAFPNILKFSVDLVSWTFYDEYCIRRCSPEPPRLPRLATVELHRYSDPSEFALWIMKMPAPITLQSLTLDWVLASEAKNVGRLLQYTAHSLRHLKIGCRFDQNPAISLDLNEYIDLSQNTGLRSLHLIVADLQEHLTPWVPKLLFQVGALPSPPTRITFEMWLHGEVQLQTRAWDDVEEILSRPAFDLVEEVVFIHRGDLNIHDTTEALERRFPRYVQRHALRIQNRSRYLSGKLE